GRRTACRRAVGRIALFTRAIKSGISSIRWVRPSEKGRSMTFMRQVDFLEPVNLSEHLGKLELYLGQVCQIAGISKMQLDYWTNKAQIPTKGKKQRIYDVDALETVMLIKQAKDKGLNLGAAIDAARRFQASSRLSATAGDGAA